MSENLKKEIISSFKNNQFFRVLEICKKIDPKDRSPLLENIIGISIYNSKKYTENQLMEAFYCFERAFLKDKNSEAGLDGLINIIKLGIKVSPILNNFSVFLYKASEFYKSVEKNNEKNEPFLKAGFVLYSYLLDKTKLKKIIKKIFQGNISSKLLRGWATFENNYYSDWAQLDHLNFALKNSKYFSKFKLKNINDINYETNKKINLGFIGSDFERNHSTTFFLKDTIKHLNKEQFETYIFSLSKKNINDKSQNELRNFSDKWFDVDEFNNLNVAKLIQDQKIDILVDLMGYTKPERLELFNSRIAPKQISWMAYCNTSGLDKMDFLIADENLILEKEEKFYSEKIIKLPTIWNSHSGFPEKRTFNDLPSLNNKNFTFGSFNNFRKISDEVVETWSQILNSIPNSNLILKSSTPCDKGSLLNKFKIYKVDHKITILNKSDYFDKRDHINLYKKIDLSLDTFPWNGVTTTFESLWMNVPVLVMSGYNFNSRCGESIIKNLKLNSLISENKDDYISKAIMFSKDLKNLNKIRKKIFDDLIESPLFNTKKFTENFSNILLKIYNS